MRLSVAGAELTTECDWELCTALRDNVQHHLESGMPSGHYPAIHALADRCWATTDVSVSAAQLHAELGQAWAALGRLGIERFAIGIRSRAALTGAQTAPTVRGTVLLRLTGWKSPLRLAEARTLGDVFGNLIGQLMDFSQRAGRAGCIEIGPVRDERSGARPRRWPTNS
jgi:hypothetical protein